MANKTSLLSSINTQITSIITQAKHRLSMSLVVDEIYSNGVSDTSVTETYTTKSGTNLTYRLTIKKQGNEVTIKGSVSNISTSALGTQTVFTFKDTEFKPKVDVGNIVKFKLFNATSEIICSLSSSGLIILGSIPASSTFDFQSINYTSQD
jgi:hypothetical protein